MVNDKRKETKPSGQMHQCKTAEVTDESQAPRSSTRAFAASKPDLDQRDNKVDPSRKAAGPDRTSGVTRGASARGTSTTSPAAPDKESSTLDKESSTLDKESSTLNEESSTPEVTPDVMRDKTS